MMAVLGVLQQLFYSECFGLEDVDVSVAPAEGGAAVAVEGDPDVFMARAAGYEEH